MPLHNFGPEFPYMSQVETSRICVSTSSTSSTVFTHGTPVLKTLDCWPTLPIVVQYGGLLAPCPPSTKDEDNILAVAALKQSDRVISINLTVINSLLEKLFAIEKPFSELEDLILS